MSKSDKNSNKQFELYDFRANAHVQPGGPLPQLQQLQEKHATLVQAHLARQFRTVINVALANYEQKTFTQWQKSAEPNIYCLLTNSHPHAQLMLMYTSALAGHLVNLSSGGKITQATPCAVPLTAINERTMQRQCSIITEELSHAWKGIVDWNLNLARFEYNPQFIAAYTPNEVLHIFTYHVVIGSETTAMQLMFPHSFIGSVKQKLTRIQLGGTVAEPNQSWLLKFAEHIGTAHVQIKVLIGEAEILVRDLLELRSGDVIMLNQKASDPLPVLVEGVPKLAGLPGLAAGHHAVKIVKKAS